MNIKDIDNDNSDVVRITAKVFSNYNFHLFYRSFKGNKICIAIYHTNKTT